MASGKRIWAALGVLLAGAVLAGLLMGDKNPDGFDISLKAGAKNNRFAQLLGLADENEREINLTEKIFQEYGAEILRANPSGQDSEGIYLPNDSFLNDIIDREAAQGFVFQKTFTQKDFQTTSDGAAETVAQYLREVGKTYDENPAGSEFFLAIAEVVAGNQTDKLAKYVAGNKSQIADLLAIKVPAEWIGFHAELLNVLEEQVELGNAVLGMEEDPIRATIAIRQLEETTQKEIGLLALLKNNLTE